MGIRLKVLLSIFVCVIVYSIYYWIIPVAIDLNKLSPFITKYIKDEFGYSISYKNAKFKMGLTPTIWLKADEFKILNDDKTEALFVEKPIVELSIFPLIISHAHLRYFYADDIKANFSYDKSLHLSLGQYLLLKMTDSKIDINKAKVIVNEYKFTFTNRDLKKSIYIVGDYFNLDKYVKNKRLKCSGSTKIIADNQTSTLNFNIDFIMPILKHIKKYPPEFTASITNLDLEKLSDLIAIISNDNISKVKGVLNVEAHSGRVIIGQKQYNSSLTLSKLEINSKYLDKPYSYPHKIELRSNILAEKDSLNIPVISLKTPKFSAKLSGSVNKLSSKSPVPNLNFKMLNVRSEDLLELLPYGDKLFKSVALSPSFAKEAGFYSNVNVNLDIKDNFTSPDLVGDIIIDDAYVYNRIPNSPKGAYIGLKFLGNYLTLDVNVPTDIKQEVNVKGRINLYKNKNVDLHITSTDKIDLAVAEKVLGPVHQTLQFQLGPVPVMGFSGFGNIDLKVKGNKKDPHTFGQFNTINATAFFDGIPKFILTNANATLVFDDFNTIFTLNSGLVNNKPVSIKGTCNLAGKFDFNFTGAKQPLSELLNIAKTSPMLKELKDLLKPLERASGTADVRMNIKGALLDINDLDFGNNVNVDGELNLNSVAIKIDKLAKPVKNICGVVKFHNFNTEFDINTKVSNSVIKVTGSVKKAIADIKFSTGKVKIADTIRALDLKDVKIANTQDIDNSYFNINGSYKGSAENIDLKNARINGIFNFKNLSLIYIPLTLPIQIQSGSAAISGTQLNLKKINLTAASMPVIIDGKVLNVLSKPTVNAYISAKPNQKFVDTVYNKNEIYPVKLKGDMNLSVLLSGSLNNLTTNSTLRIEKGSSLYYMGASIKDNVPIKLSFIANYTPKSVVVKSFLYDKLISSQNHRTFLSRQLSTSGDLIYTNNIINFKNFRVKTYLPTDTRIFNVVFKKPFIKEGQFESDVYLNGTLKNPQIRGDFSLFGMDIPFLDTTIKDISLKFMPTNIHCNINGELLTNKFNLKAVALNKLIPPYIVNNANLNVGNFNVNAIIDSLKNYEVESTKEEATKLPLLPVGQFIVNNFDINADNIHVDNIDAKDLNAKISFKNNILDVKKFNFILAHGAMNGSIYHSFTSKKSNFTLNVSGADADKLLSSLFELSGQLYGAIDGDMAFSCTGESQSACLKTLNGQAKFQVKNGRMPKLGSLEYLLKAGNLVKSGITGLSLNGLIDLVTPLKTGNFDIIKGNITVNNGIADKIQIISSGRDLNLFITGIYNMSNYYADMYVFGRLSKKISNGLGPIGNASLNTLFSTIPGVNLNATKDSSIINDINKIPGVELSNKLYRIFAVEVHGDISGDDYVDSFRWVE